MSLVAEFQRRNVHRLAGLYLVASWLIVQVSSTVLPAFDAPGWVLRTLIIVLAVGFVPALVISWVFELTPQGLKRERDITPADSVTAKVGQRMDRLLLLALALAIGYFGFDKFVLAPRREALRADAARSEGRAEGLARSYGDKSIAVLPFLDLSPAHDQGYFSDGIAEELLNLLARVPQLRVISRASAFSFKGSNVPTPEIAERLHVAHVLEGSVRKSGDRVRVTAQLVDAHSDTQLWSQSWDRQLDDVFTVQDQIAAAVVQQLRVKLLGTAPRSQRVDPRAYELFLQGRAISNQASADALRQAAVLLAQAVEIAPDYSPAWTALSVNDFRSVNLGLLPRDQGFTRARDEVDRAIAVDPTYAFAYAHSGWLRLYGDNDLQGAATDIEQALRLAPDDGAVLGKAAALLYNLGRFDEAIALGRYEVSRDPLYAPAHFNLGVRYQTAHRYREAVDEMQTAVRLSPGMYSGQAYLGLSLLMLGNVDAALAEIRKEPNEADRLSVLALAYHRIGRHRESDQALRTFMTKYGRELPAEVASVLAFRGETDEALQWLDKAIATREPGVQEISLYFFFDGIRSDPRWVERLRVLRRAPEQLAVVRFNVRLPQTERLEDRDPRS
jgi:adenylate cyclase